MSSQAEILDESTQEEWIETADKLFKITRKRKRLNEKYRELSNQLRDLSDYQTTKRGRYEYRLITRKGPIEYGLIPELKGVDLEEYRKGEVKSWKLEVVE